MSEYTGFILANRNTLDHSFLSDVTGCRKTQVSDCTGFTVYVGVDVDEWSRALDVRLSEGCCNVSMVWAQIPSREEQKFIYV